MSRTREPTRAEVRAAIEEHARWLEVRVRIMCASDCYATSYEGGYKLRRLPSADEEAWRMR